MTDSNANTAVVSGRLRDALNRHDLDAFVDCFAADYHSEQPVHPDRAFSGSEQVRKNWSAMFGGIPDIRAELVRSSVSGDTEWAEWRWYGTPATGGRLDMRGVTILGIREGRIAWGRLYMEPVEQAGAGIDAAVQAMTEESP